MTKDPRRLEFFDNLADSLTVVHPNLEAARLALVVGAGQVFESDLLDLARALGRRSGCRTPQVLAPPSVDASADADLLIVSALNRPLGQSERAVLQAEGKRSLIVLTDVTIELDGYRLVELDFRREIGAVAEAADALCATQGVPGSILLPRRYADGGYAVVEQHLDGAGKQIERDRFCRSVSYDWTYRDSPVAPDHVRAWLNQFAEQGFEEEARDLLRHLLRRGFVRRRQIEVDLKKILQTLARYPPGRVLIPLGIQPSGKSEGRVAYDLRPEFKMHTMTEGLALAEQSRSPVTFACVDDVIGSGGTFLRYLFDENSNAKELVDLLRSGKAQIAIVAHHVDEDGRGTLLDAAPVPGSIEVHAERVLTDRDRIFRGAEIVSDRRKAGAFRDFCEEIGARVYSPDHPLGWGGAEWCVALDYTVPNLSLPLIFQDSPGEWLALFPRDRTRPS